MHSAGPAGKICCRQVYRSFPPLATGFSAGIPLSKRPGLWYIEEAGVFTVYGNDPAGRRYVPYQGPDEKAGVRKLFAKLLDECHRLELYPENRQD